MRLCHDVASIGFDGAAFNSFSFQQDGLPPPEIDAGRGEVTR